LFNPKKKIILLLTISFGLFFLTACSSDSQEETDENAEETTQQENTEQPEDKGSQPEDESAQEEEDTVDESGSNQEDKKPDTDHDTNAESVISGLKPDTKVKKVFNQNDEFTLTETIVDMNDEYLQRVFQIGDMVTLQVLKWDNEVIQVVYEQSNPEKPEQSILDEFSHNKEMQPMADINRAEDEPSEWKLVSKEETVTVPYKTFEGVYSVRSKISEGNANTIHTIYFAPGIGMIKEIFEETGDDGYTVESVLEEVKPL
jgi:hypothetical protein